MEHRYNELPLGWDATPHALLGIVGAKRFHEDLRNALLVQSRTSSQTQAGSLKAFDAISLDDDFQIPAKSSPPVGIKKFQIPIRGLLKTNWMEKWHSHIPGLILLTVDLKAAGRTWEEQETFICDQVEKLRQKTLERRINIAVILVLTSSVIPRDEHLFSLKKRGSLDAKQVYKLTPRELQKPECAMVSKTWKNAQEMLISFYTNAIRKYNKHLKLVKNYVPLQARHTFKIAYFLEVLGDRFKAQQQYRTAMRLSTQIHSEEKFEIEQVKVFAALSMWRIYSRTLLDKKAVDAHRSEIFRAFIVQFRKRIGGCRYRHFGWLAQQCLVFARQLDGFDEASSMLEKPNYFRDLAVQYAIEQRIAAQKAGVYHSDMMKAPDAAGTGAKEFKIEPPEFVGGQPNVVDPKTGEPFDTAASHGAFHALERQVDHSANIKVVLAQCIAFEERAFQAKRASAQALLRRISSGNSPKKSKGKAARAAAATLALETTRSLARKKCALAEEHVQSEDYERALELWKEVLPVYERCQWPSLSRFVLQRLQETSTHCGNHDLFVDTSLRLLAQFPDTRVPTAGNQVLSALAAHRSLATPETGSAAVLQVNIDSTLTGGLFSVECQFAQPHASPNDAVGVVVTVISNFPRALTCQRPRARFSDPAYDCDLVLHQNAGDDVTSDAVTLPVGVPVQFVCELVISADAAVSSSNAVENQAKSTGDLQLCLLRVETTLLDASVAALCHLSIATDDDGKSSIAATQALSSAVLAGNAASSAAAASGLSQKARQRHRRRWLAISPAVAEARVSVSGDKSTLYGAMHRFRVDIQARSDTCLGSSLILQVEGLRAESAGDDFACVVEGVSAPRHHRQAFKANEHGKTDVQVDAVDAATDESISFVSGSGGEVLEIDPVTGNAHRTVKIPDLQAEEACSVVLQVTCRAVQTFELHAALQYCNTKRCSVITPTLSYSWRCVNPVEAQHTVDYVEPNVWPWLSVGQSFIVRSSYTCNDVHPVELLQVDTKVANRTAISEPVLPVWQQQPPGTTVRVLAALAPGDVFSTINKFTAERPFQESVGQAIVHWRPVGAHALSDPTGLDRVFVLPSVHADVIPLSVEVSLPALIRCGEPFTLRVAIVNQTDQLQSARVVWFQGVLVHHEVFLLHLMFLIFVVWVRCA
eukprot:INCI9534.1.p1 GENE.INCI9534.1~~INCI9534.1.p1  ORF type:complete len:1157 (-),score=195.42 INCI9534.1:382-3852(-)